MSGNPKHPFFVLAERHGLVPVGSDLLDPYFQLFAFESVDPILRSNPNAPIASGTQAEYAVMAKPIVEGIGGEFSMILSKQAMRSANLKIVITINGQSVTIVAKELRGVFAIKDREMHAVESHQAKARSEP